jgi:hypothetical protein
MICSTYSDAASLHTKQIFALDLLTTTASNPTLSKTSSWGILMRGMIQPNRLSGSIGGECLKESKLDD